MKVLEYELKQSGNTTIVQLAGAIDENASKVFKVCVASVTSKHAVIDLAKVTFINSIGCRDWARTVSDLLNKCIVDLVNCPVPFIDYANFFPAILGSSGAASSAAIKSFRAPYRCKACDHKEEVLLTVQEVLPSRLLPSRKCPACSGGLLPEPESEDYLQFLDRIF